MTDKIDLQMLSRPRKSNLGLLGTQTTQGGEKFAEINSDNIHIVIDELKQFREDFYKQPPTAKEIHKRHIKLMVGSGKKQDSWRRVKRKMLKDKDNKCKQRIMKVMGLVDKGKVFYPSMPGVMSTIEV